MLDKHPTNQISIIISALKDSPEWDKAMSYRNTWVHDKPPIIEGLGIEYDRKSRISETVVDGVRTRQIGFGGGSEAKYKIDEIDAIATNATTVCVEALNNLLQIVIDERTKLGESFDFENRKISSNL
jgi:hypothetical protein